MDELVLGIIARVFPSFVTVVLTGFDFNRSLMIQGIEAYSDRCPDYEKQKEKQKKKQDYLSCLAAGATALGIALALVGLASSLCVSGLLPSSATLRIPLIIASSLLFAATLGFIASWKKELFKVEERLSPKHPKLAKNFALVTNIICVICSIIVSGISVLYP